MSETGSRRKRPAKRRKIRCNLGHPCSNCLRSRGGVCVYETRPTRSASRDHVSDVTGSQPNDPSETQAPTPLDNASNTAQTLNSTTPSLSVNANSTNASSPASQAATSSSWDAEAARARIKQLEEQLGQATRKPVDSPDAKAGTAIEATISKLAGTYHLQNDVPAPGQKSVVTRNVVHKNRLFGRSHWTTGVAGFRDIFQMIEPLARDDNCKVVSNLIKCKQLAGVIKARRKGVFGSIVAATNLPPRNVADELVSCYMRTCESFYRVLHIPTFRATYDACWSSEYEPDPASLVQIKLVLAIGAVTYDERFSMRDTAVQWTYEAQSWLAEPKFKSRLNYQSLQTDVLLLVAQELVGPDEDSVWMSAGMLLRKAVYMGLHRDPSCLPKMSIFAAEMRRRMWNTILEIVLQSSMTSGCPPMISLEEFDTESPANFDDEQLVAPDSIAKPEKAFTQTSVAIALRKTFRHRLQIAKSLNDLNAKLTFEDALQIDSELRVTFKSSRADLQQGALAAGLSPFHFDLGIVDLILHRYLAALHIPFFNLALDEFKYAYSRKAVIENALKIWHAAYPSEAVRAVRTRYNQGSNVSEVDYLSRLIYCSSGSFRLMALQASYLILMEVRNQVQEEQGMGHLGLRPDLLAVLEDAKKWSTQYIKAGTTNIKGYLVLSLVAAQIEGLIQGLEDQSFPAMLVRSAEEAEEFCLALLEEIAERQQANILQDGLESLLSSSAFDALGDLDFDIADGIIDFSASSSHSFGNLAFS